MTTTSTQIRMEISSKQPLRPPKLHQRIENRIDADTSFDVSDLRVTGENVNYAESNGTHEYSITVHVEVDP